MNAKYIVMKRHSDLPKIRIIPGDKKRHPTVMRPTLKRLKARLGRLNRNAKNYRGQLRKTAVGETNKQQTINGWLLQTKIQVEAIFRYLGTLA